MAEYQDTTISRAAAYYRANKEARKAASREYYKKHSAEILAKARAASQAGRAEKYAGMVDRVGGGTRAKDLTGIRFGRLTVSSRARCPGGAWAWQCVCDCGKETLATSGNLRSGRTNSCGCLNAEKRKESKTTHGLSKTRTYRTWSCMKARCLDSSHEHWKYYGGRGVSICNRWLAFENFLEDMGIRPEGMTLDRVDVNGNYEPSNCRWATQAEQNSNKRPVVLKCQCGKCSTCRSRKHKRGKRLLNVSVAVHTI